MLHYMKPFILTYISIDIFIKIYLNEYNRIQKIKYVYIILIMNILYFLIKLFYAIFPFFLSLFELMIAADASPVMFSTSCTLCYPYILHTVFY